MLKRGEYIYSPVEQYHYEREACEFWQILTPNGGMAHTRSITVIHGAEKSNVFLVGWLGIINQKR